jgi:hypothetical protein
VAEKKIHYKVLHWSNSIMLHLKEILSRKTTLATKIAEDFNAKTVLERCGQPFYQSSIKIKIDMPFRLKCLSSPTGISNYPMIWRNLICLKIFWLQIIIF